MGMFFCTTASAVVGFDAKTFSKSIVFLYGADSSGNVIPDREVGTAFLVMVRMKEDPNHVLQLVITARHIVDPIWAGCATVNPNRLFARINTKTFDPAGTAPGTKFVAIDLIRNNSPTWFRSSDDGVDVAALSAPDEMSTGDVLFIFFRNFGSPEEIAKMQIGSQVASAGLVPGVEGKRRNYPVFKFGKIASIPDEPVTFQCKAGSPPRALKVWWIAANLVAGNSGSPILFDPLFPPGSDVSVGEPRAMIIGLQSLAVAGADLAGMTPSEHIVGLIQTIAPQGADLTFGVPAKRP
jgi:hypothetical protein